MHSFEMDRLIAELSTVLCRSAEDDVASVVEPLLGRLGEFVAVDRVALVENEGAGRPAHAYRWTHPSAEHESAVHHTACDAPADGWTPPVCESRPFNL